MAKLYIVSTPIGNLADITYRAVETLNAVDRVLAEDTRRTSILLRHYGIQTRLYSAHAHNERARSEQILGWLDAGEAVALVSDAGTPLLSDPGARIVQTVLQSGHEVIPIPGASALLAALVAAGLEPEPFTFFGFLARSGRERKEQLARVAGLEHVAIVYEAPGRVGRLMADLLEVCGPERRVVVGRELTKLHESFRRGTLAELAAYYEQETVRGEVVVLVAGAAPPAADDAEGAARVAVEALLDAGSSARDAAREVAQRLGVNRNRAYEIALSLSRSKE